MPSSARKPDMERMRFFQNVSRSASDIEFTNKNNFIAADAAPFAATEKNSHSSASQRSASAAVLLESPSYEVALPENLPARSPLNMLGRHVDVWA